VPREWLVGLGVPLATASAFLAAALGLEDGPDWLQSVFFAGVAMLPMVVIAMLTRLAIASDTNGSHAADVVVLEPRLEPARKAA
jgi:hypothetical protein